MTWGWRIQIREYLQSSFFSLVPFLLPSLWVRIVFAFQPHTQHEQLFKQKQTKGNYADLFIQRQQQKLADTVLNQFSEVTNDCLRLWDANQDGLCLFSPFPLFSSLSLTWFLSFVHCTKFVSLFTQGIVTMEEFLEYMLVHMGKVIEWSQNAKLLLHL